MVNEDKGLGDDPVVIDLQNMPTEERDRYTRAELKRRFEVSERPRMSKEESKSDAVKEARELLNVRAYLHSGEHVERLRATVSALCDEVERLQGERDGLDAAVTVQAESIIELQSQLRVMKEAIEGGIEALDLSIAAMDAAAPYCARDLEIALKERSRKAEAAINELNAAITPKGSER